jgi:hypothetical protein
MAPLKKVYVEKTQMIDTSHLKRVHEANLKTLGRLLDLYDTAQQARILDEAEDLVAGTEEA